MGIAYPHPTSISIAMKARVIRGVGDIYQGSSIFGHLIMAFFVYLAINVLLVECGSEGHRDAEDKCYEVFHHLELKEKTMTNDLIFLFSVGNVRF